MFSRHFTPNKFIIPTTASSFSTTFIFFPSPLPFISKRTSYFVQHKKTPNADCMMFVVPHHRFRIGSQVELERAIREANERKFGKNNQQQQQQQGNEKEAEEEDWDGPGVLVGNKTSQETREEKESKARKIAVEQFHIQRRKYFAQRAKDEGLVEKKENVVVATTEEAPACEISNDEEQDFIKRMEKMPKSRTAEGSSIHRAASMPTKKQQQSNQQEQQQQPQLPSGFLDDNDESTYVSATYTFTKESMHQSPLAKRVFECEAGANIIEVVVGKDFITVRRKSEEDLIVEKVLEASGEKQTQEEQESAQNEIIATSFGTLSGMMGNNNNNKQNKEEEEEEGEEKQKEQENKTTGQDQQRKDQTRENLAKLYEESEQKKEKATMNVKTLSDQDAAQTESGEKIVVADWFDLQFPITAAITDHLHFAEVSVDLSAPHPYADTAPQPDDSEVVLSIKELIAGHLRPLLQSDGGDIRFCGFFLEENAIIKVEMLGSCKTCKKSDTTLRDLIERTIRHFVPEVKGVEEINGKLAKYKTENQ